LLDEQTLGVLEQSPFHEKQSAIILEPMDQNHLATVDIVASLAPFQFFIETRRKAQFAQRGIFSAPARFLAMDLADERILFPFESIRMASRHSFHIFRREYPPPMDVQGDTIGQVLRDAASLRWPDHAYFRAVNIYTIGYEGLALEAFLQQLRRARVQIIVDVRDVPLSRKRGFSKKALAAALNAAGMDYLHIRSLGCPKAIRDQYRANRDWEAYTAAFLDHLRNQGVAVGQLAAVCKGSSAALLCYEADAGFCHRTYVARAAAAILGSGVLHLGAAGITPDRAMAEAA
jgi:hypothetical protein